MKKLYIMLFIIIISLVVGCKKSDTANPDGPDNKIKIVAGAPKAIPSLVLLRMAEQQALGNNVELIVDFYQGMEKMAAQAARGEAQFIALPINAAAVLYNKGINVKLINAFLWGGFYLVTTDPDCKKWSDLKNKQLYVPNRGSAPDLVTRYFLQKHGIDTVNDIDISHSGHTEISQLIRAGKIKNAIDVQPFVTINKQTVKNYKVVHDFLDEWKKIGASHLGLPNFGIIVNTAFLEKNQPLVKKFNQEYQKHLKHLINNPSDAALLAMKHLNANKDTIEQAIPDINFHFEIADAAKDDVEMYLKILMSFKPASIGGKLPDAKFYTSVQ